MTRTEVREGRYYTENHEWMLEEGTEIVVGITDYAQSELTDVVFVDLPPVGKKVAKGESALVLESVKTVSDVYAPCVGSISLTNLDLKSRPGLVNQKPYDDGWIFRMTPATPLDRSGWLSATEYRAVLERLGKS